jgi:hypothetical protein
MFDKSKLMIMVTGTTIEPWDQNWKECESTWIPELRKLGYTVMVAIGNPNLETEWKIDGDMIWFKAEDTKRGLYDKSIRLPIKWILEETNYEYYFRIDSDSFTEPNRFEVMLNENFKEKSDIDYMGCCHPVNYWNPNKPTKFTVCRERYFASGCGYLISKKAMKVALEKMRMVEDVDPEIDDWVLGRAMWENEIPLFHDGRIYFESKYNEIVLDESGVGVPDIGDPNSHLAIQHYMNGHMEEAMVSLGYRNK